MHFRLTKFARELRKSDNEAEQLLWSRLRGKQLLGSRWRRQETLGKYIVDFVCLAQKLVVEVDGGQHAEPAHLVYDQARTAFLTSQGFRVLRFWANEVLVQPDAVLMSIARFLNKDDEAIAPPQPSPVSI